MWYLLPPTPSTSLAMKTPQYIEEDPVVPEPAGEGDILMEYSLIRCAPQV